VPDFVNARRTGTMRTLGIAARPTLLFAVAYALNTTPHEAVHALTAYVLGFNSIIYQMWVNPEPAQATPQQLATIAASGPIFSLTAGALCLLIYAWRFRKRPSGLLFILLALVGVDCFLGPMAGAQFGGDFRTVFELLGISARIGVTASAFGWILLALFMFLMGRELVGWVPRQIGRFNAVLSATAGPALAGPLLISILYWPLPRFFVGSTIAGSLFWIFALFGATTGIKRPHPERDLAAFTWVDASVSIAAIVMIRVFASGIRLAH